MATAFKKRKKFSLLLKDYLSLAIFFVSSYVYCSIFLHQQIFQFNYGPEGDFNLDSKFIWILLVQGIYL